MTAIAKTAHTDKLKSVEGREGGMSGKNTGCTSMQGLGLGNGVLGYLPVQIQYILIVFSEEKYMHRVTTDYNLMYTCMFT